MNQPQSFLSNLRDRSAIVFTIGLALSIASFVENLHMGKDAIAFVVAELSKIDGWADAVKAVAAILHGALEWWRGILKDLFSFLPFDVPQWLHDPISIVIAAFSRAIYGLYNAFRQISEVPEYDGPPSVLGDPEYNQAHSIAERWVMQLLLARLWIYSLSAIWFVDFAISKATDRQRDPIEQILESDPLLSALYLLGALVGFASLRLAEQAIIWVFARKLRDAGYEIESLDRHSYAPSRGTRIRRTR